MNITCLHKEQNPFVPSHISPLLQQRKGSQVMYNILNKNNEIQLENLHGIKYISFKRKNGNKYIYTFLKLQTTQLLDGSGSVLTITYL